MSEITCASDEFMTAEVFLRAMMNLKTIDNVAFVLARNELEKDQSLGWVMGYEANILELALVGRARSARRATTEEAADDALLIINTVRAAKHARTQSESREKVSSVGSHGHG